MATAVTPSTKLDLDRANQALEGADAVRVVEWAAETFGDGLVMSSSFGAQAAVMLHLVTRVVPDVPVVFIDTGFHFPETYKFADELTDRLKLNLKVYQSPISPAWMVARYGRLWEGDKESLDRYDRIRKVEPMDRALRELKATAWLAGLRRGQTDHRASLRQVEHQNNRYKVHPILTWDGKQVHEYLKTHDLPYHPLHDKGYASIGDWHSTRAIGETEHERDGRFRGLKQECGLHIPETLEENDSRTDSML